MPSREQEAIRRINRKVTPDITQQGVVVSEDEFLVIPVHDTYTWVCVPEPHQEHTQTIGVTYGQYQAAYAAGKKILVDLTTTTDGVTSSEKVYYYADVVRDLSVANAKTTFPFQSCREADGLVYQNAGVFELTKDTTTLSGLKFSPSVYAGDGLTYGGDSLTNVYIVHEIPIIVGELTLGVTPPTLELWATNADFVLLEESGLLINTELCIKESNTADKYILRCTNTRYDGETNAYASFAGQIHNATGVYSYSARVNFAGDDEDAPECSFRAVSLWEDGE